MAWFKLHGSMRDHRKIAQLSRQLGVDKVVALGHVVSFFCRVVEETPDGDVGEWHDQDIADAAQWRDDSEKFVCALIACGIIDRDEKTQIVHGWMENAESYNAAKRAAEYRKRKNRKQKKITSPSRDGHVTITSPSRENHVERRREEKRREEKRREDINNNNNRSVETSATIVAVAPLIESRESAQVLQVFAHYKQHRPERYRRPSSKLKEWGKIKTLLAAGYTVDDLCTAIDGCMLSPWHQGANERGKRYDSLELICRDSAKIEAFIALATDPQPVAMSDRDVRAALMDRDIDKILKTPAGGNNAGAAQKAISSADS
ncbi:MAG: hypothetical protein E6Q97_37400 [Desulfurellales bacterium]|nr:MAG: hypothetical protein E6Q97_37400 [Desulfurellales bacterium]